MRLVLVSCLLVPSIAAAEEPQPPPEDFIETDVDLTKVEHEASAGYEASVSVAGDAGGTGIAIAALGGDASYTASFGKERSEYEITVDAGASLSRMEGTVRATGASTFLHLALGPAPAPLGNKDLAHAAPFPLTFELDHEGDLAALPRLSDRPDVMRAPYLRQTFALATRAYMMEVSDDGVDERPGMEDVPPVDRSTSGIELFPIRGAVTMTGQDGTRVDASGAVGLMAINAHEPMVGTADLLLGEHRAIQLADGNYGTTDTLWILRGRYGNPSTGTEYQMSWGLLLDQSAPLAAREHTRDHQGPEMSNLGGLGLFSDDRRPWGVGAQYLRDAYVTMAGEPAVEDRMFVEGWWQPHVTRLSARLFTARTSRQLLDGEHVAWTGGVELDARREVGKLAVGLHAEGGQSYYATLDGGAPERPGFGARAALTVSRAARWVRGTR